MPKIIIKVLIKKIKCGKGSKGQQGINYLHKDGYLVNVAHKVKKSLNHVV